jgi:hypothetical protein
MDRASRSLRARLGAHALHAKVTDPKAHTEPARKAWFARFEHEVDPRGVLTPEERSRRAEHAMRAHMSRLALKSAQVRSRKGQAKTR